MPALALLAAFVGGPGSGDGRARGEELPLRVELLGGSEREGGERFYSPRDPLTLRVGFRSPDDQPRTLRVPGPDETRWLTPLLFRLDYYGRGGAPAEVPRVVPYRPGGAKGHGIPRRLEAGQVLSLDLDPGSWLGGPYRPGRQGQYFLRVRYESPDGDVWASDLLPVRFGSARVPTTLAWGRERQGLRLGARWTEPPEVPLAPDTLLGTEIWVRNTGSRPVEFLATVPLIPRGATLDGQERPVLRPEELLDEAAILECRVPPGQAIRLPSAPILVARRDEEALLGGVGIPMGKGRHTLVLNYGFDRLLEPVSAETQSWEGVLEAGDLELELGASRSRPKPEKTKADSSGSAPPLEAEVVAFNAADGIVVISAGADAGVRVGERFTLMANGEPRATLQIEHVTEDFARARFEGEGAREARPGDRVLRGAAKAPVPSLPPAPPPVPVRILETEIVRVEEGDLRRAGSVILAAGAPRGAVEGQRLTVHRDLEVLALLRIDRVTPEVSIAQVVELKLGRQLRAGDRATSRVAVLPLETTLLAPAGGGLWSIGAGSARRVERGLDLMVLRDGKPRARLRVVSVQRDRALAEILGEGEPIRPGDRVVSSVPPPE